MIRKIDYWLVFIVTLLTMGGMLMVFSASAVGNPNTVGAEFKYLIRQGLALTVGLVLCFGASRATSKMWRGSHKYLYIAMIASLILCLVPGIGHSSHGAARWIGFGSVNFQPSAFAKISVLISLAAFLHDNRGKIHLLPVLIKAGLIPLGMIGFIIVEPDFGTSLIIGTLSFFMMIIAGMRLKHLMVSFVAFLGVGFTVLMSAEYRVRRMLNFLDPWQSRQSEGYQVVQSWIAMHNGGLTGQGLGNSLAKRQFLPEPWTDFIAAVIAEELGFIGMLVMIALFGGLLYRGLQIARHAKDAFSMYLATALTFMIVGEAFFNLGVVMGVVPPKGLVLPFISYGSSAMMANMTAIGILIGISAERQETPVSEGWYRAPTSSEMNPSTNQLEAQSSWSPTLDQLDQLEEASVENPAVQSVTKEGQQS